MSTLNISDAEGRFALIGKEALRPVSGQHLTLTMMQASLADVPKLIERVRDLESRIKFVQHELAIAVPDEATS